MLVHLQSSGIIVLQQCLFIPTTLGQISIHSGDIEDQRIVRKYYFHVGLFKSNLCLL